MWQAQHVAEREAKILSVFRMSGATPLWTAEISEKIGYGGIATMEAVRHSLKKMVKDGVIEKVAPFDMSGRQYYRIANPEAAWKEPGDLSPTRSESTGAQDRIGDVAISPWDL